MEVIEAGRMAPGSRRVVGRYERGSRSYAKLACGHTVRCVGKDVEALTRHYKSIGEVYIDSEYCRRCDAAATHQEGA